MFQASESNAEPTTKATDEGGFDFSDDAFVVDTDTHTAPSKHEDDDNSGRQNQSQLEIAASARDITLEDLPDDFDELPAPLQEEFVQLQGTPVLSSSQFARSVKVENTNEEVAVQRGRTPRHQQQIKWDMFMPDVIQLKTMQILAISATEFCQVFAPFTKGKGLQHIERVFNDIEKSIGLRKENVFLRVTLSRSKKRDGCSIIPFGFIPMMLHYLRPARIRKGINVGITKRYLKHCYATICSYFSGQLKPIIQRQLRQFETNLTKSVIGSIGDPIRLYGMRVSGDGFSISESSEVSSSSSGEAEDSDEEDGVNIDAEVEPDSRIEGGEEESNLSFVENDDYSDVMEIDPSHHVGLEFSSDDFSANQDDGNHANFLDADEISEVSEASDASADLESSEEPEIIHNISGRRRSSVGEQLRHMKHAHCTDRELNMLISHHIEILNELNEEHRRRLLYSRKRRETRVAHSTFSDMKPMKRVKNKKKKPSIPRKRKREVPTIEEQKEVKFAQPSSKRTRPLGKPRVYRMQSSQLMSSLPKTMECLDQLIRFMSARINKQAVIGMELILCISLTVSYRDRQQRRRRRRIRRQ
jgi:hypothetical protein